MDPNITTVLGRWPAGHMSIVDSHNHVWIEPVNGVSNSTAPVLNQFENILDELIRYRKADGQAIVDCQPGGCGRNGNKLAMLSKASGVAIVACTGFHRPIYYAPDYWLWNAPSDQIAVHFIEEIESGFEESRNSEISVKAGFIKIAFEQSVDATYQPGLIASAQAAIHTGKLVEIHTEKGMQAEKILDFFLKTGVVPSQIVLCHMDKRPDFGLHRELAEAGVLLEYDTFYRAKYEPEKNLWILISRMLEAGHEDRMCLATDMAESTYWKTMGGGPGLDSFPTQIRSRLAAITLSDEVIDKLMGVNICRRLAGIPQ